MPCTRFSLQYSKRHLDFIMVTNVVINFGWAPMKIVGEIAL